MNHLAEVRAVRQIISASRRTDIPAFYPDWFVRRLRAGTVYVRNSYGGRVYEVSLKKENVHSVVFWSKNYSPLLSRLGEIEKTTQNLFFHFTITGIPKDIERNTPPLKEAVSDFIYLAKRYPPSRLVWRFDPVCITDKLPFDFYEETFSRIAEGLEGNCVRCYMSFVRKYRKVVVNFERYSNHVLIDVPEELQRRYAARLGKIAGGHGMVLYECCNDYLLSDSVHKGSCINGGELSALFNDYSLSSPATPTRRECACTKSRDIGSYDTCPHGCLYCYANTDRERSAEASKIMDENWNGLGFHAGDDQNSAKGNGMPLFL